MACRIRLRLAALSLAVWPASAQAPANGTSSSAPDNCAILYLTARASASEKRWPETIQQLRKVAGLKAGLDPSRDPIFAELRSTAEFREILATVREATPPVSRSRSAFRIEEGDLVPESVAYDSKRNQFYFGSMKKGKVVRCSRSGECAPFATGLGVVLGLKVRGGGLWVLNNAGNESALIHYDLASAREVRRYKLTGAGHNFNDLVIARTGEIYLTDTPAATVWYLANESADLARLPGRFQFANGIALSPDLRFLYVSTFLDGISVVNLKTGVAQPIARAADLCLANIDGLYFHRGSLIAIQNGFMTPRVVRLLLTRDRRGVERFEVLERRNPLFDGVTTGVVAGRSLFYMANIQDDKEAGFDPIAVLALRL